MFFGVPSQDSISILKYSEINAFIKSFADHTADFDKQFLPLVYIFARHYQYSQFYEPENGFRATHFKVIKIFLSYGIL